MEKIVNVLPSWMTKANLTGSHIDIIVAKAKEFYMPGTRKDNGLLLAAASAFVVYLGIVRYLRYKNLNYIRKKYPNPQDVLDNIEIAREIHAITLKKEFPFIGREGLEFALFKTYTIPSISKLLAATGEFGNNCPRRAEDTELILHEILDTYARIEKQRQANPKTPHTDIDKQWERTEMAQKRLNEIHGKYKISNGDYLYTLSLFIYEPVVWINKYDWRQLDEREINAFFRVWYNVGVEMNLKDIPETPEKMLEFKNKYANDHIRYAPSNWKCGDPTIRHLLTKLPSFFRESGYRFLMRLLPSLLDREDAEAFKLPHQESKVLTMTVKTIFCVRALVMRHFMLPRSVFVNRTPFYGNKEGKFVPEFFYYKPHIYKNGYTIGELGPEKLHPRHNINVEQAPTVSCPVMHEL